MQFRLTVCSLMLSLVACSSAPPVADVQPDSREELVILTAPQTFKLQPADRIEVVLTRPDFWPKQQHYRAIISEDGGIDLPRLGKFSAADKTIRSLEREILARFNGNGRLRGSVRVIPAPISLDGFFITPSIHAFGQIMDDPNQVAQLDRNEHAKWQWVSVDIETPINTNGHIDIMTIQRNGARWTIARPAHPELVSERLTANIDKAVTTSPGLKIKLKPVAAIAMENVTRQNNGARMLLVMHARVVNIPHIETLPDREVRITAENDATAPMMQLFEKGLTE
jgi:hypothetical protein